jgi:putative aldouronate transport system permease protein
MKEKSRGLTAVSIPANVLLNILVGGFALICVLPFVFVTIVSFTDEASLAANGYSFIPGKLSLAAYRYIMETGDQLATSFLVSVLVTVIGTVLAVGINGMYAYVISRKQFKLRNSLTFIALFTMLFSGGLVPYYVVCTQVLHLRDSLLALILPLAGNAYWILILRTFFATQVPESMIESAKIDGAGEVRIFFKIVAPVALPALATIALFACLAYWNDWWNAMLFISDAPSLTPLQYLLIKIERNLQFMMNNSSMATGHSVRQALYSSMPMETMRMAMVVLATLPIACAYPFFQRFFVQGLTIGSIKG